MTRVLIIADDLTGAADTGAQFARRGWRTLLVLRHLPSSLYPRQGGTLAPAPRAGVEHPKGCGGLAPGPASGADVLVLSTDSRALPTGAAAAAAVIAALAGIPLADFPLVYKKIDSTLRGHPAAELAALLARLGETNALIAPAFPAQGRTTRGGAVQIHGVPLEQTSFGAGPGSASPLRRPLGGSSPLERGSASTPQRPIEDRPPQGGSGDLPRLFGRGTPLPLLSITTVRSGLVAIRMTLAGKTGPWIADAETDDDLRRLAQTGLALGWRVLCGSAGLANALAECLGPGPAAGALPGLPPRAAPGAVLAIAGSLHPATAAQVQAACRQGAVLVQPSAEFFADPGPAGVAETVERLAAALARGGPVILATLAPLPDQTGPATRDAPTSPAIDSGSASSPPQGGSASPLRRPLGGSTPSCTPSGARHLPWALVPGYHPDGGTGSSGGSAARKLAQTAAQALARAPAAGLFLTGGDTARAVCRALGCTRLWLGGEVEPGIPWAYLADGQFPGLPVVTKAGGFGAEGSLAAALRFLGSS